MWKNSGIIKVYMWTWQALGLRDVSIKLGCTNTNGKGIRRKLHCINCRDTMRENEKKNVFLLLNRAFLWRRFYNTKNIRLNISFPFRHKNTGCCNWLVCPERKSDFLKITTLDDLIFSTANNSYFNNVYFINIVPWRRPSVEPRC